MTGMPAVAALQTADGMGSAVVFMIVDVEDASSGSVPRALVMVRDELLCFLNLSSFLKMVFISLSESWCSKRGDKVAARNVSTPISLRSMLFFVSQIIVLMLVHSIVVLSTEHFLFT